MDGRGRALDNIPPERFGGHINMKRFIFTIMPHRVRHAKPQPDISPFITRSARIKHWGIKHQQAFISLVQVVQPGEAVARYNLPTAV